MTDKLFIDSKLSERYVALTKVDCELPCVLLHRDRSMDKRAGPFPITDSLQLYSSFGAVNGI